MESVIEYEQGLITEHLFLLADAANQSVSDHERGPKFLQTHLELTHARLEQLEDQLERSHLTSLNHQTPGVTPQDESDPLTRKEYQTQSLRAIRYQNEIWCLLKHIYAEEAHAESENRGNSKHNGERVEEIDGQLRRVQSILGWLEEIADEVETQERPDLSMRRTIARFNQVRNDAARQPQSSAVHSTSNISLDPDTTIRSLKIFGNSDRVSSTHFDAFDVAQESRFGEMLWHHFRKGGSQLVSSLCEQTNQLWRAVELSGVENWIQRNMPSHPSVKLSNSEVTDTAVNALNNVNHDGSKRIFRSLALNSNLHKYERALYAVLGGYNSDGRDMNLTSTEGPEKTEDPLTFESCLSIALEPCRNWSDVAWVVFRLLREELVKARLNALQNNFVTQNNDSNDNRIMDDVSTQKSQRSKLVDRMLNGDSLIDGTNVFGVKGGSKKVNTSLAPLSLRSIGSALKLIEERCEAKKIYFNDLEGCEIYLKIINLIIAGAARRMNAQHNPDIEAVGKRKDLLLLLTEFSSRGSFVASGICSASGIQQSKISQTMKDQKATTPMSSPAPTRRRTFCAPSTTKKTLKDNSNSSVANLQKSVNRGPSASQDRKTTYDPFLSFAAHLFLYLYPSAPNKSDLGQEGVQVVEWYVKHLIELGVLDATPAYIQLLPEDQLIQTYAHTLLAPLSSADRIYFIQGGAEVYPRLRSFMLQITRTLVSGVLSEENESLNEALLSAATRFTTASDSQMNITTDVEIQKQNADPHAGALTVAPQNKLVVKNPKITASGPLTSLDLISENSILYTCPMIVDDETGETEVVDPSAPHQSSIAAAMSLFNSLSESEQRCIKAVDSFDLEGFGELVERVLAAQSDSALAADSNYGGLSDTEVAHLQEALLHVNCLFRRLVFMDALPAARFLAFRTSSLVQLAELALGDVITALTEPRLRRLGVGKNISDEQAEALGNAAREAIAWRDFLLSTHLFQLWHQHHDLKPLPVGLPDWEKQDPSQKKGNRKSKAEMLEELDAQYVEWANVDRVNVEILFSSIERALTVVGGWLCDVTLPSSTAEIPQSRSEELMTVRGKVIPTMVLMLTHACSESLCVDLCERLTVLVASEESQIYKAFVEEEMEHFIEVVSNVQRQVLLVKGSALL